jgi:hypothetical protein
MLVLRPLAAQAIATTEQVANEELRLFEMEPRGNPDPVPHKEVRGRRVAVYSLLAEMHSFLPRCAS